LALAALGVLHSDLTLATAALAELSKHRHKGTDEFIFLEDSKPKYYQFSL